MNYLIIEIQNKTDFELVEQFIKSRLPLIEENRGFDIIKDYFFEMNGNFSRSSEKLNAIMFSLETAFPTSFPNSNSKFRKKYGPNVKRVHATELENHYNWLQDLSMHPSRDKVNSLLETIITHSDHQKRNSAHCDLIELIKHNNQSIKAELIESLLGSILFDGGQRKNNLATFKPVLHMLVSGEWVE